VKNPDFLGFLSPDLLGLLYFLIANRTEIKEWGLAFCVHYPEPDWMHISVTGGDFVLEENLCDALGAGNVLDYPRFVISNYLSKQKHPLHIAVDVIPD
jgi:hypothetical protein